MRGHAVILAATLAWSISIESAEAKLDILVDKATQRMLVIQDGYIRFMWPVSTGRDAMQTPNGVYAPQRLERNWSSTAYYDSPMPFSIFFYNGYAIHGSYAIDRLGGPASHGCVRLHPHHAAILFDLVQQEGPNRTSIEVTDQGRPAEPSLLRREIRRARSLRRAQRALPARHGDVADRLRRRHARGRRAPFVVTPPDRRRRRGRRCSTRPTTADAGDASPSWVGIFDVITPAATLGLFAWLWSASAEAGA